MKNMTELITQKATAHQTDLVFSFTQHNNPETFLSTQFFLTTCGNGAHVIIFIKCIVFPFIIEIVKIYGGHKSTFKG